MRYAMLLTLLCTLSSFSAPQHAHAYALKTTSEGVAVRWQQTDVALRIDASVLDALGSDAAYSAATMASEAWRGLSGAPDVTIERGAPAAYDSTRRNNGVYLLAEWPFEDDQVAMTITSYTTTGVIVGVDILLNGERSFEVLSEIDGDQAESGTHDLAAVLTHEIGHALGLAHSDADPDATMFPRIRSGETHQRTLSTDDEQGITKAYAAPLQIPVTTTTACTTAPVGAPTQDHGAAAMLLSLAVAFTVRARRRG